MGGNIPPTLQTPGKGGGPVLQWDTPPLLLGPTGRRTTTTTNTATTMKRIPVDGVHVRQSHDGKFYLSDRSHNYTTIATFDTLEDANEALRLNAVPLYPFPRESFEEVVLTLAEDVPPDQVDSFLPRCEDCNKRIQPGILYRLKRDWDVYTGPSNDVYDGLYCERCGVEAICRSHCAITRVYYSRVSEQHYTLSMSRSRKGKPRPGIYDPCLDKWVPAKLRTTPEGTVLVSCGKRAKNRMVVVIETNNRRGRRKRSKRKPEP